MFLFVTGAYAFVEATDLAVGSVARLISPQFPDEFLGIIKCLSFQMVAYGEHIGYLKVLDEAGDTVWIHQGGACCYAGIIQA